MGRITKHLTDREIKGAKAKEKRYMLFDGGGLVLEVMPSGRKYWRLRYRLNGKNKLYTLGEYPRITLADAREEAFEFTKLVKRGIDVKAYVNKEILKSKTIDSVAAEFFEFKKLEFVSSHLKKQIRRYEIYIKPKIGNKTLGEVEKIEVINIVKSVKNTKTNSTRNTDKNDTSRRIFLLISQFYSFAMHNDYIDKDPTSTIDINKIVPKKQEARLKAITDLQDIRTLYSAIINDYKGYDIVVSALRFLALTALRPGNVANLKWEWVYLNRDIIIFPAAAMKSKKEFRLPLTKTLKDIILNIKRTERSEYVFASPIDPKKTISNNTLNVAHKRLGYPDHNAHGWRSAFSTICYEHQREHKFGYEVIESQLAHSVGNAVKMAYLRSDFLEERRELLLWWEQTISC